MKNKKSNKILALLYVEKSLIEQDFDSYPLPVPSYFNEEEKQSYLSKINSLNEQYKLLKRIIKITENVILNTESYKNTQPI